MLKYFLIMIFWPLVMYASDLRVGYIPYQPFAFESVGKPSGFAIDMWEEIAAENQLTSTFIPLGDNIPAALEKVAQGDIDVLLGPISVTRERLKHVDFTRPFFIEQVGVAFRESHMRFWETLYLFFQNLGDVGFFIVLICFFVVAHIYWFFYRWHIPEMSARYWRGIGDSMWLMFARLIQIKVLYDPEGPRGRILMAFWLLVSLIFVSGFFGMITSALSSTFYKNNNQNIYNISTLKDKTAGVIEGSNNALVAKKVSQKVIEFKTLRKAIDALDKGVVDILIGDYVILDQAIRADSSTDLLKMSDLRLAINEVAFALPKKRIYKAKIDRSLLRLQDKGFSEAICNRYIPSAALYCTI